MPDYMSLYFEWVIFATLVLAPLVFALLFMVKAPYGRHLRTGWGFALGNRLSWLIMESTAVLVFGGIVLFYAELNVTTIILFALWQLHYCHRAFLYPLTLRKANNMPLSILLMGLGFNASNGYINGWSIVIHADQYTPSWLSSPQFVIGSVIFIAGMTLNKLSDLQLMRLSRERAGIAHYRIPYGFAYRWVSCPNYLGEIIQWTGWAIATWSLAGVVFAIWTMANLVPRALTHHRWYRDRFSEYPADRRALIPFVL